MGRASKVALAGVLAHLRWNLNAIFKLAGALFNRGGPDIFEHKQLISGNASVK